MYSITIIDALKKHHSFSFKSGEYYNLMELIVNMMYEDIGDCKGKALCGTCLIIGNREILEDQISDVEKETISKLGAPIIYSRLACQIMVNKNIHGMIFTLPTTN